MSYNKKYSIGSIALAEPYFDYVHTLPLVTFSDVKNTVELALVYNSQIAANNYFNIANGYKFNLQKKLVFNEDSIAIQLVDANGLKVACNPATNGTDTHVNPAYALNDSTHRVLRKTSTGYEMEYPDYSREEFGLDGKLTKSFDKYGEEIFRYEYESSGELKSIAYRPEVGADYKKFEFSYSSNRLTTITYSANGTPLTIGTFSLTNNGFDIQHYSDVKYHLREVENEYIAYSTITNTSGGQTTVHRVDCTKTGNTYVVNTLEYGVTKDTITYDAFLLGENNEIKILDITNFYDIKTRVQYKDHRPYCSYEYFADENVMFDDDDYYVGSVQIQEKEGINGIVARGVGYRVSNWFVDFNVTIFPEGTEPSLYTGEALFTGWIKAPTAGAYVLNINTIGHTVKVEKENIWQFFAIPFNNFSRMIAFLPDSSSGNVDIKGCEIYFLGKHIRKDMAGVTNYTTLENHYLENVTFANEIDGDIATIGFKATFDDIHRYLAAKKKGRTNEFYYNDGRNLITNADTILIRSEYVNTDGNTVVDYELLDNYSELTKWSYFKTDDRIERYIFNDTQNFLIVRRPLDSLTHEYVYVYNDKFDMISSRESTEILGTIVNEPLEAFVRNGKGLVTTHTIGEDITRQYTYDTLSTKLLSDTDEFGAVTNYETDLVWGVVTKATVGSISQTESDFTDDGADLEEAKFGGGITKNNIAHSDGNVSQMSTGEVSYLFGYTNNDLTSISKKKTSAADTTAINLKTFTYADNYKSVTAKTHTGASSYYVTTAVVDDYGRELSVSGLRENTYALYPHFDENGAHTSLGEGGGSNLLKTSKDLTNNKIKEYSYVGGQVDRVVTKLNDTQVDEEYFEYDAAGRPTKSVFKPSSTQNFETHITYETGVNRWDTDKRIKTFQNVVSGVSSDGTSKSATTTNSFDKKLRLTKKTNTLGGLAYSKEISYNKTRVSNVYDSLKTTGNDNTTTIGSFGYTYDDLGRIASELDASTTPVIYKSYKYDMAGRLVRENNSALNKTYTYEYDSVGNVTSKKTHAYTTANTPGTATATVAFSYDTTHPDRLTSFGGKAITYDQQGCPLTYDGKTYTWTRGKLTKYTISGLTLNPGVMERAISLPTTAIENWTYTYNGNGQRTQKKYTYQPPLGNEALYDYVTSKTTNYTYDHSGRLVKELTTTVSKNSGTTTSSIVYLYDDNGIIGMVKDGASYYFHRNIQGDVVGVYANSTGTKLVTFKYDAYGNCTVNGDTSFAQYCKIRYRGYYFDAETGLYWVQTRYYNPEWCRWISPDKITYIAPKNVHGINLYAFCGGDPINYKDSTGTSWTSFWEDVKNWFNNTFGVFKSHSKRVKLSSQDFFFGGRERGVEVITSGEDRSKPISFFFHRDEEFWKFWEWEVGISINFGEHNFKASVGLTKINYTYSNSHKSVGVTLGAFEAGVEIAEIDGDTAIYTNYFFRPVRLGLAGVFAGAAAYGGSIAVPAMGFSLGRQSIFALIEMVL